MRKLILSLTLIILMQFVLFTEVFAAGTQTVTLSWDTTTSLTKEIIVETAADITVEWGDGSSEEITIDLSGSGSSAVKSVIKHTYSVSGKYDVSFSTDGITMLDASAEGIISIDLSQASSLKILNVDNNKLTELELSENSLPENVSCANNQIQALDFSSTDIKILNCSNNPLSTLAIPATAEELYVRSMGIGSINGGNGFDLSGFSQLKILDCSDNGITELILSNCNALEKIICSDNSLESLSLTTNKALKELMCDGNKLGSLDISENVLLEKLNCVNNFVSELNIQNNVNLTELYVFGNELSGLDLNNIAMSFVVTDNITCENNAANVLIKISSSGSGLISWDENKVFLFPGIPTGILINNVEQENITDSLDVSGFISGVYEIAVELGDIAEESAVFVNSPQILNGMIPVKHNGTNWVITHPNDSEWYNYGKNTKKWANVMLRDSAQYLDFDGTTLISVGNTDLNNLIGREVPENSTGSMYVWIPRFSYKVLAGNMEIEYSQGLSDYTKDEYKTHPAFNYAYYDGGDPTNERNYESLSNTDRYLGIWVAKYPAGGNISNPKYSLGATALSDVTIGEAFSASKLTSTSSSYGLNAGTSHMMKNTEWGAVAYLTTASGVTGSDSTTGNVYGIYGMNSGEEYVSTFVELVGGISNLSVRKNGRELLPYNLINYSAGEAAEMKDIEIIKLISATDGETFNLNVLESFWGTGIEKDIGTGITGNVTKNVPTGSNAFLTRGTDGIYAYSRTNGAGSNGEGFRNTIFANTNMNSDVETFIISSWAGEGGTISPLGNTTVECNSNISFVIKPNTDKEIIDVIVDGISVFYDLDKETYKPYSIYEFKNVTNNHNISVTFDSEIVSSEVKVVKYPDDTAGDIEGEGFYNSRSTVTLRATGKNGYKFAYWSSDDVGNLIDKNSEEISFTMPSNGVTLEAYFEQILKAMLYVENMYVKLSSEKDVGETVNVSAGERSGYVFAGWIANGITSGEIDIYNPSIEFIMPSEDVYLEARYNGLYPLTVNLDDGTKVKIEQQETTEINIIASESVDGKYFSGWTTSGLAADIGSSNEIVFVMPGNGATLTMKYGE